MVDFAGSLAHLENGPFDGLRLGLGLTRDALPTSVVITFVVGEDASDLAWHSYVLDRSRDTYRYLGEQHVGPDERLVDASSGPEARGPRAPQEGEQLTRRFYAVLFDRRPDLRLLFAGDLASQAAVLHRAIEMVLAHLDDPVWLTRTLGHLGARHAQWGVTPSMYEDFCDCMLTAMAETAGESWTLEQDREWRETLGDISRLMIAGAAGSAL